MFRLVHWTVAEIIPLNIMCVQTVIIFPVLFMVLCTILNRCYIFVQIQLTFFSVVCICGI